MFRSTITTSNFEKEHTMAQLFKKPVTTQVAKVLCNVKTHTTDARENGVSRSSDCRLDIRLLPPGSAPGGTNPEQPFEAG